MKVFQDFQVSQVHKVLQVGREKRGNHLNHRGKWGLREIRDPEDILEQGVWMVFLELQEWKDCQDLEVNRL